MFTLWRVYLFLVALSATKMIPLQQNFLGGGMSNYQSAPWIWGWANFDGEHFLSIARYGYKPLQFFYFPVYPLVVRKISYFLGSGVDGFLFSGILSSNLAFFLGLIGFWKLIEIDYGKNITRLSVLLLLIFPTSFYFGSFYSEALFLCLSVWAFYFARKKKWFVAVVLASIASATRVIGIILLPALAWEMLSQNKSTGKIINWKLLFLLIIPVGLLIYMRYLYFRTGDYLEFLHSVEIFGSQRSSSFIVLPQVFYRYFFKILPSLNHSISPVIFTTYLELFSAIFFLTLCVLGWWKIRRSYWLFMASGYLLPTLSGSFSSMPRYVSVLFPGFILLAQYNCRIPLLMQKLLIILLLVGLAITSGLFIRGYWIA